MSDSTPSAEKLPEPDTTPPEMVDDPPSEFSKSADPQSEEPPLPDPPEEKPEEGKDEGWNPTKIVSRAEWGAQKPHWIEALDFPINKVAVSFTETDPCYTEEECITVVRDLQKKHLEEPNVPDIKHNFLIGGDGVIYEGRGYTRVGPVYAPSPKKIEELNGKSIDVALIERSTKQPTKKQVKALSFCMANGVNGDYIAKQFSSHYIIANEIDEVQNHEPDQFHKERNVQQ